MYNNAKYVNASIMSIKKLKPKKIFIVDNFSTDGTYEILKSYKNILIEQIKCNRGKGRDIALKNALENCNGLDHLLYIDLDTVYKMPYLKGVIKARKNLKSDQLYLYGSLSTAETNRKIPWRHLNFGEDIERIARAKSIGIEILGSNTLKNIKKDYYGVNAPNPNGMRESRYANGFSLVLRLMQNLIDTQRSYAYKSFSDFYNSSDKKSKFRYFAFFVAYVIAKILGVYEYDKRLNNADYVLGET